MSTPASLPSLRTIASSLLEFVADVRPLYVEANLAIVPTLVSAGTNLKVLEAMAMDRAVVSTSSGCAGLGPGTLASTSGSPISRRISPAPSRPCSPTQPLRRRIAAAGRVHVERNFDWRADRRTAARAAAGVDARARPDSAGRGARPGRDRRHPGHRARSVAMAKPRTIWPSIARWPFWTAGWPDFWFRAPWPIRNARS